MVSDSSFDDVMARLRAGDQQAAAVVFNRFANRVNGLARKKLDTLVRPVADPEDVGLSVIDSFIIHHKEGRFDLENWDSLWALLATITVRKCGRWNAWARAKERDLRREVAGPNDDEHPIWLIFDDEPKPEEAAIATDTVEILMRDLAPKDRQVFVMRLQGYSVEEIHNATKRTEYTVNQILEKVKRRLRRLLEADPVA